MTDHFSAAEQRVLDSFAPPPMRDGFASRLVVQLDEEAVMPARRRDPRGPWKRRRMAILGGIGAGLLSVGAAASGILGVNVQNMPVIASIAAVVKAPSAKPAPKALAVTKSAVPPVGKAAATPPKADVPPVAKTADPAAMLLATRIEQRLRQRTDQGRPVPGLAELSARHAIMVARGDPNADRFGQALAILATRDLPPATGAPERRLANLERRRAMFEAMTPEQREVFRERQRERQAARLAARESGLQAADNPAGASPDFPERKRWRDMTMEERQAMRERRLAREAAMTPEQRARLEAIRAARRERRMEAIEQDPRQSNVAPPEMIDPKITAPE